MAQRRTKKPARKPALAVDDRAGVVELPPLPAFVFTALGEIPVREVASIPGEDGKPSMDMGFANYHTREILIRSDMAIAAKWATLFHEQAHFLVFDAGLKLPHRQEEHLADAYGTLRFQEMVTRR